MDREQLTSFIKNCTRSCHTVRETSSVPTVNMKTTAIDDGYL